MQVRTHKEGRVSVSFIVDEMGAVKDVRVVKPLYPSLDAEAIRVIASMPRWKPGSNNGKNVAVTFVVPVEFKL